MRISIKLLSLALILFVQNLFVFAMNSMTEKGIDLEIKVEADESSERLDKINKYRDTCLSKCGLYKDLSHLIQEYDPIEDEWESEQILTGISGFVNVMCELPGNRLALSFYNHTIQIWDILTKKREQILSHENNFIVHALCVLPKNKLASGSGDKTIKIWNITTGKCEKTLKGHEDYVNALCVLSKNKLASGSGDKTIKIWNIKTGECKKTLKDDHGCYFNALCVLPGNKLASGSRDKTIKIWNAVTGRCEQVLSGHSEIIDLLCVLPGDRLASSSRDEKIIIWDLVTGKCEKALTELGMAHKLCLLPGNKLAIGCYNEIKILDIVKNEYKILLVDDQDNQGSVNELCALPGNKIASGSGRSIKIWSNPVYSLTIPEEEGNIKI